MSVDDVSASIISMKNDGLSQSITLYTIEDSEEEVLRKMKSPNKYWSLETRPTKKFVTESSYKGLWNVLGMHSSGKYNFFYGPRNDGYLYDNMFHGPGSLVYPNNSRMEGMWEKGHMTSYRYYYPDDLCFGPYCQMPDRSFILERRYGLKPAGRSLQINAFKPREIPTGCYDTVDGFYDPKKKYVFDRRDPKKIVRIPTKSEHLWILEHCRKAWDEPAGFRPDLYENWYQIKKINLAKVEPNEEIEIKRAKARFENSTQPNTSDGNPTSMGINFTT